MSSLLDRVRDLTAQLGRSPTHAELTQHRCWYRPHYQSAHALLVAAGVTPRGQAQTVPLSVSAKHQEAEGMLKARQRLQAYHPSGRYDSDLPMASWMD